MYIYIYIYMVPWVWPALQAPGRMLIWMVSIRVRFHPDQAVFSNCLDLYPTSPDFGERQVESMT